jgi:hypothetical protein
MNGSRQFSEVKLLLQIISPETVLVWGDVARLEIDFSSRGAILLPGVSICSSTFQN